MEDQEPLTNKELTQSHEVLERTKNLSQAGIINFDSYTSPVHHDQKRWLFNIMGKKNNTKSRKMTKEKKMFQTKEHDTTPEMYLKERSVISLKPLRISKQWSKRCSVR